MSFKLHLLTSLPAGIAVTTVACWVLMPLLIRLSPILGLVDKPNQRKVHYKLIPAIGGLAIGLAIACTALVYSPLLDLLGQYAALSLALLVLLITGVVDDRLNSPAWIRLLIQVFCAFVVAHSEIRLTSLHGLFGITELPVLCQYGLTMLIITGMTNAFNLLDGVDGLAGSHALINCLLLSAIALLLGQSMWLSLLMPLTGALLVFLTFNWRPARLFMGDGGSIVLGFLMAVLGIEFVEIAYQHSVSFAPQVVVLSTASCMIPIMDALRVFGSRLRKGTSPFLPDQNHLHHWLLKHHMAHSQIAVRIGGFHILLLVISLIVSLFMSISTVFILQLTSIILYTSMLQFSHAFLKSYRLVKKLEIK